MLVAHVESRGTHPTGHMVIGHEEPDQPSAYFGYRVDLAELPEGIGSPATKDFLFNHAVPGDIVDETPYVALLNATPGRIYYSKQAECGTRLETVIPDRSKWRSVAKYSFNPDDFHTPESPCYNCVTWATEVGNRVSPGFLIPVRQGRIKLMVVQLQGNSNG